MRQRHTVGRRCGSSFRPQPAETAQASALWEKSYSAELPMNRQAQHGTYLKHDSGLLQQIRAHVGSNDMIPPVKADLNVLSEAAAVVVACRLRIANSLGGKYKQTQTNKQTSCSTIVKAIKLT